jgi:4-hydroxythreonine-4-phosphate dehydrogenase
MGDPAGIGPDIILLAWRDRISAGLAPFVVAGDPQTFRDRAMQLNVDVGVETVATPDAAIELFQNALPVYPLRLENQAVAGQPDATSSPGVIQAIDIAVEWVMQGKASAIVTCPINKNLLTSAGFSHPGHTEYLAELSAKGRQAPRPVMLLTSGDLKVVPVTVHMPLRNVPDALTIELIMETVGITASALREHFRISQPRIGVTGLNPHAGEGGLLGREEIDTIGPAIDRLKESGLHVTGPLPADATFQERFRSRYDVIVAMYHDQALLPIKTIAFDRTVNMTLGLPLVRTSPDHGTAYDLAGTGKANPNSLIASLRLAAELTTHAEPVAT